MILYEDKDIIVCHKMAGIAVQSARIGEKDLVSMLNNHLMEQADQRMEPVRVVHRLDQPVEGIVVFAKNKKAAASLSAQITDGSMKKVYQAVSPFRLSGIVGGRGTVLLPQGEPAAYHRLHGYAETE